MNAKNPALLAVLLLVVAVVFTSGCVNNAPSPQVHSPVSSQNIMSPWGMLSSTDVQGEDIQCIGRYPGMTRGLYTKNTENDGSYNMIVVYYSRGDIFSNTKTYFTSKAEECGYTKESETNIAMSMPQSNFAKGYQAEYSKGDDTLSFMIGVIRQEGNDITLVHIEYTHAVPSEEEATGPSEPDETENNGPVPEVVPTGDAETWNSNLKPVLERVFGTVYLTSYSSVQNQMTYLKYSLTRKSSDNDVSALSREFENSGYTVVVTSTEDAQDTVTVKKDNKYIVVVFYRDGDYVEVSVTPQS